MCSLVFLNNLKHEVCKNCKVGIQEQELRLTTIWESVLNQIMKGGWETHRSIFSHSSVGVFFIGSFIQWSSAIFLAMHWLTVGWPSSLTNNGLAWKLTVVYEELNLINTYTLSYLFVPYYAGHACINKTTSL